MLPNHPAPQKNPAGLPIAGTPVDPPPGHSPRGADVHHGALQRAEAQQQVLQAWLSARAVCRLCWFERPHKCGNSGGGPKEPTQVRGTRGNGPEVSDVLE